MSHHQSRSEETGERTHTATSIARASPASKDHAGHAYSKTTLVHAHTYPFEDAPLLGVHPVLLTKVSLAHGLQKKGSQRR